jgi:regulatory protein
VEKEKQQQKEKELRIIDPLEKARRYCAYQERAQQEVRDKLYESGCHHDEVENIIITLIAENFLNEERFAITYARGKFRIKQWGKVKIRIALKQKKVSDPCIKKALAQIDADEYLTTIKKCVAEKVRKTSEKNPLKKNYKVAAYVISRGFEADLVWDVLNKDSDF